MNDVERYSLEFDLCRWRNRGFGSLGRTLSICSCDVITSFFGLTDSG